MKVEIDVTGDKYDAGAEKLMISLGADAVFLIVLGQDEKSGMSFVATKAAYDLVRKNLPDLLREFAVAIEKQNLAA